MTEAVKMESSPGEAGPAFATSDAASVEVHQDDHFSDDEPETELEALQHLPPEERRKALRRLRNRESARRVRARRLAEMSQMGATLQGLQDENSALKAHVSKLQSHIQSMTMKVYEVTAKYESAVAENAQLRTELIRFRRPSAPGDSSFTAPKAHHNTAGPVANNGPNSAPLNQQSPFASAMDFTAGTATMVAGRAGGQGGLSAGHVQLRSSSPMDLQQQRQALDEVVLLLKEHKRRNQGCRGQDPSGSPSDMCSSGAGGGTSNRSLPTTSDTIPTGPGGAPQPTSDLLTACGINTSDSCTNAPAITNNNDNGNINKGMAAASFNFGDMRMFAGNEAMGTGCGLGGGATGNVSRSSHSEALAGSISHQQLMTQVQARMAAGEPMRVCEAVMSNGSAGLTLQPSLPLPSQQQQQQPQQLQMQPQWQQQQQLNCVAPIISQQTMSVTSAPLSTLNLQHHHQQQQQHQYHQQQQQQQQHQFASSQQPLGQSHSHPLIQLPQMSYNLQHQCRADTIVGQQPMQACCDGVLQHTGTETYGSMSSLSLSAPFCSTVSSFPGGGGCVQMPHHASGPNALGSGVCGIGSMPAAGFGGGGGGQHHSASWALERGAVAINVPVSATAQNVVARHPGWQMGAAVGGIGACGNSPGDGGGCGGGIVLRGGDLAEDLLMSLDDFVPQDL